MKEKQEKQYYLCFRINKIPDLTMVKYSVYDISGQEDLIEKHSIFLRQLHRLGVESDVFFHLLYFYDGTIGLSKGKRLQVIFYATAKDPSRLERIREFVTTSVLSTYYEFYCYEISDPPKYKLENGKLRFVSVTGNERKYALSSSIDPEDYPAIRKQIWEDRYLYCAVQPGTNEVTEINNPAFSLNSNGSIFCSSEFKYGAFLTKKDYHLFAQNSLYTDPNRRPIPIFSIMEWIPNETGRLYNVLKLMEGYNETAALRIDIFPEDIAEKFNDDMTPCINDLRKRMMQHDQGKDENSDIVLKSIEAISKKLMKFPAFSANVVAMAKYKDIAVMLVDSVGAEAVESGSYLIKDLRQSCKDDGAFGVYDFDDAKIIELPEYRIPMNYMADYVSLYTLDEIRPMFSFPVLYPGETIECLKETDPEFGKDNKPTVFLGTSDTGYDVDFPVELFKKHAFIAGVPGSGKTNTLLYLVRTLWKTYHLPFLVLEPAKQEYRALSKVSMLKGMEELQEICFFSPGADTKFPLHINPFEFPKELTLAEHIANLNAVFAGAFELPPPSPHFIDTCIEQVYMNKGWNINSRNTGELPYPTMQELYDSLNIAVQNSHYQGEMLGNLRSVMEVRIGSLLKREIGNVYNVEESSFAPEQWIERPVVIELESLGEGPANFMALLISTLIRETLKVRKTQNKARKPGKAKNRTEVNHIIFYEEAHNLVGPTQEEFGDKVDPKVSATKYLVKMLAEVRALNEGIVIADQIPSAMAPEVLKNTGLKIGHRITASDDRELLGSTMSASADQLAEQSVYLPGEALIFYEGLLKPFKMRMQNWKLSSGEYLKCTTDKLERFLADYYADDSEMTMPERIKAYYKDVSESPTDAELYSIIRDYPVYKELMTTSMNIILRRVRKEFRERCERFESLNRDNIIPAFEEASSIQERLFEQERHYCRSDDPEMQMKSIEDLRGRFTNPKSRYYSLTTVIIDRKKRLSDVLIETVAECNQLLFNNISIVNNYGDNAAYMGAQILQAYLNVFDSIDYEHVWDNATVQSMLQRIEKAKKTVSAFFDPNGIAETGILAGTEHYAPLFESTYPITGMRIAADFNSLHDELIRAVDWAAQKIDAPEIKRITALYEEKYRTWMEFTGRYNKYSGNLRAFIISKYLDVFDVLGLLQDRREIAHILYEAIGEIRNDIERIVLQEQSRNGVISADGNCFKLLSEKLTAFSKVDIFEYFYQAKVQMEKVLRESAGGDYSLLREADVCGISFAYQSTFFKSSAIYFRNGSAELLEEAIDMYYTLFLEFGVHLSKEAKSWLRLSSVDLCKEIRECRAKRLGNRVKQTWKKVDAF